MSLNLVAEPLDLELARPFTISRGTRTHSHNVLVRVHQNGIDGFGECAPNARYGQSQTSTLEALLDFGLSPDADAMDPTAILSDFDLAYPHEAAARAGLSMALWDWAGRAQGLPLCRMLGIDPTTTPVSSYTISIDDPDQIRDRVLEVEDWPVLKVKLGGGDADVAAIESLRACTSRPFRIDANEAWELDEAIEKTAWLATQGCEFVEQPLAAGQLDAVRELKELSPLPLVADEDVQGWEAVDDLVGVYDGVNVKLAKCGGIREAIYLIHRARKQGLDIMLGCMVEDNLGIAAAAHLSPLCRWADLDAARLLKGSAFTPDVVTAGEISIPVGAGLGVTPRDEKAPDAASGA